MILYDSPSGWYFMLAAGIILWLVFAKLSKTKLKTNAVMGLFVMMIAVMAELIGTGLNLWSYTTGNWPFLLWPSYFFYGMLAFSLFKIVEKRIK